MIPFTRITATACPMPFSSIDTDQLIPARFMKRSRAEGYGDFLLHDLRFGEDGTLRAEFPLNDPRYGDAGILVARRNFGAGSSREAAVYALADYGIRCVVAPSFGDIFAGNAVNNGLLPARISEEDCEILLQLLQSGVPELTIDLDACTITAPSLEATFEVEPVWRTKLLNGWDDLDLTASFDDDIRAFVRAHCIARPWASPKAGANDAESSTSNQ